MNIEKYRPSFTIHIIDKNKDRGEKAYLALREAGYNLKYFLNNEQFFTLVEEDPPHTLFVEQDTFILMGEEFVEQTLKILPEVHIIIYTEQTDIATASHFFQLGVYDCVAYCGDAFEFIVKAADRAALCDFYMYMNEQINMRQERERSVDTNIDFSYFANWLQQLNKLRNLKEVIDVFLTELSRYLGDKQGVFFKYIPSHQSLVISQSIIADIKRVRGVGFELGRDDKNFTLEHLHKPMSLKGLKNIVENSFETKSFSALPLMVDGVPEGVFVFIDVDDLSSDDYILSCLRTTALKASHLNIARKLQTVSIHDDKTRVLNKSHFIETLKKEISRSRRLTMPIALVIISIDDFESLKKRLSPFEVDSLLKMCATILRRHSRVNDVVGRIGPTEFGIILPHTGKLGGAIKAERIRRIFESADFTKVIPGSKTFTVSIGVSEYPSHCRDYEDILKSADEALLEVKTKGRNKVCLASAPEGFVPDFVMDGTKL